MKTRMFPLATIDAVLTDAQFINKYASSADRYRAASIVIAKVATSMFRSA